MTFGVNTLTRQLCVLVIVLITIVCQSAEAASRKSGNSEEDPFLVYPYRLHCSSPFGIIASTALPGSEVPVDKDHDAYVEDAQFLTLELYETRALNVGKPGGVSHTNSTLTTSKVPTIETVHLQSLPQGLLWDVSGEFPEGASVRGPGVHEELAFSVNNEFGVIVSNPTKFGDAKEVEFWVVLVRRDKGSEDEVVSNPMAFIIRIVHTEEKVEGAAVYVGIVVIAVCLIALLIPLTVRTKRRLREGKPVCACGSSTRKKEENTKREAEEKEIEEGVGARKEDIAILYDEGFLPDTARHGRRHESIQSHNLRSVSEPHFQPTWLDPHYKHGHEHPHYHKHRLPSIAPSPPPSPTLIHPAIFSTTTTTTATPESLTTSSAAHSKPAGKAKSSSKHGVYTKKSASKPTVARNGAPDSTDNTRV